MKEPRRVGSALPHTSLPAGTSSNQRAYGWDVTFLDCAGVNLLLATRRRARLEGGWVRITQASSRARRTISLLGLREVFELGAHRSGDELADQKAGDRGGGGHADGLGDRRQQASAADHAPSDA